MNQCRSCKKELPQGALFCCWCGVEQNKRRERKKEISVPKARRNADGTYRIQLRLDGKSIVITEQTERECIAKARAVKAGVIEVQRKPEKITLTKAIDRYIDSKSNVLSPETVRGYRVIQKNRFPSLMVMDVGSITKQIAQRAVNAEAGEKSSKTVSNAWAFCNTVIQGITGERLEVSTPMVVSEERKWLSPNQIKTFCSAIKGDDAEVGALLALSSLRKSEILGLTWDDVDLKNRVIHVRGAKVYDENHKLVEKKQNKNKSSRRDVPIMMEQLYTALSAVDDKQGSVFVHYPEKLRRNINAACEKSGLPCVGVHGLRHSFASLAASLKLPEHVTMQIGGWADATTMRKIYTHVAQSDISNSQNAMSEWYNA